MNNTATVPNDTFIDEKIRDILDARVIMAKDEIERLTRSYIRASTNVIGAQRRGDTVLAGWLDIEVMKVATELDGAKETLKQLQRSLDEVEQRLNNH